MANKLEKTDAEWRAELTEEQYQVLRQAATERAFTGEYHDKFDEGEYKCAGCGMLLFESSTKFDAGCGWPSFHSEATKGVVEEREDLSHGRVRTETLCANCGGHLGHVFPDGPQPTGLRYCINSAAIRFMKSED